MLSTAKIWALRQLLYEEALRKLHDHFTKLNIGYMPIKGAHLILSGIAQQMSFRRMDDIDILVCPADLKTASDYFFALPKVTPKMYFADNSRPYETAFVYHLNSANINVEIHSILNFPERFTLETTDLFARGTCVCAPQFAPCAEDALLIFLCHLFTHFPFEWRETNFEEISLLCKQENFSWEKFNRLASSTGLQGFIYFIVKAYEKQTGNEVMVDKGYWYAGFLAGWIGLERCRKMPFMLKRLLCELPFVKRPWWMMRNKLF